MDWIFCKMDRGMFSFVLPLVVHLFCLQSCFMWKKYCQMHSADLLYFSRKNICSIVSKLLTSEIQLINVVCRCLLGSVTNGILPIFIFTLRGLSYVELSKRNLK